MNKSLEQALNDFDKAYHDFSEASNEYDKVRGLDVSDPVLLMALQKYNEAYKVMEKAYFDMKRIAED